MIDYLFFYIVQKLANIGISAPTPEEVIRHGIPFRTTVSSVFPSRKVIFRHLLEK